MQPQLPPSQIMVILTGTRILVISMSLRLLLCVLSVLLFSTALGLGIQQQCSEARLLGLAVAMWCPIAYLIMRATRADFVISIRRVYPF